MREPITLTIDLRGIAPWKIVDALTPVIERLDREERPLTAAVFRDIGKAFARLADERRVPFEWPLPEGGGTDTDATN